MTSPFQEKITKVYNALTNKINLSINTHNTSSSSHQDLRNSKISYGQVDSTSTSTVFTATVPNLNELTDGATVMLRNGVVSSATGFTLNVNGLGAKPVYASTADATRDTNIFNIAYTMLFVYDSSRISGGCWICYRGYDSNSLGYQLRTNGTKYTATDKGYRYRLWLQTSEDGKFMPVNTSTSTNATANRSNAMNNREFIIGGDIRYYGIDGTTNQNAEMNAYTMWQQYTFTLGYSFNNTGSALSLIIGKPVYMIATPTSNGKARLTSPYYTQSLPNSEDGKIYILLGYMYSATNMELTLEHPVFEYRNGSVGLYNPSYTISEVDTLLNGKANSNHTHSSYLTSSDITGKENTSNKIKSTSGWSSTTTDDHYPSEKLVKSSLDNKVDKENGKGLFSGSYGDLSNKPSYTATVTSSTTGAYKMGSINISGSSVDIYGKDTHQSLTNYIQKTSTDTGYLKSNGNIASLPTASTSQSGVVQLSNSTSNSSETLGATAKAVKTVYDSIPTIPTNISSFTNDSGYLTSHQDISGKENSSNKVSSWSATTNNTRYPSEKLVKDSLDNKAEESDLLDLIYPIGSIYMKKGTGSTNICPIEQTLGGTWTRIENRFLYASENGQGVGSTGGSADAVVVEHNHEQNAHQHQPNNTSYGFLTSPENIAMTTKRALVSGTGNYSYLYGSSQGSVTEPNVTADTKATNIKTGVDGTGKNMPPYIIVNVWERTA